MWSPDHDSNVFTKENIEVPSTPRHGKWYGPCTPQEDRRSGSPRESPRLSLTMFAKTPRISFGKVKIGCSKVKRVVIDNPLTIAQSLHLEKWPDSKGFIIFKPVEHKATWQSNDSDTLERNVEFIIPGMSEMDLPIMWKPNAEGNYRELVTLTLGDFNRLNLIIFGNAVDMTVKTKPKMKTLLPEDIKKSTVLSSQKRKISKTDKHSTNSVKSKRILRESNRGVPEPSVALDFCSSAVPVVKPVIKSENRLKGKNITSRKFKAKVAAKGIAPSRLTLTKHLTTERSLPRHPLPYAAKNMYYDEKWMEKQERGFVQWLNHVLTPPDELVVSEGSCIFSPYETTKDGEQHLAPTKEVLSLRAYTAKRKMARLRRSACLLYQSPPIAMVAKTIEGEVERNRLKIRADKHFHQDLGIKETMVKMLLSYNSLWLRIGLETIYGEILTLHSNNDIVGLKRFLKRRFLANPDVSKEYRHPTVAEAYRPGYYEALKKFTLKKFLLLILFLDKAKLTRLIDHDPCLFNKDAEYKSSRFLLLSFSRDYLKGEGDVTKHLGLLNYIVTHEQIPLDEMDYAVTNLAVDLRDGLRITRVIELLTQNWRLSASLRVPVISRLQKIHNVDVAINALKERGILAEELNSVNPRHIVDGHREKTLSLLWMIILHFQVNQVVNEQQIKDEIAFLKKYSSRRNQHSKETMFAERSDDDVYSKSEKLSLLLEWCRGVCRLYGVKVDNFTVSMSDGRVMCYLLHYYHPSLLREEDICQETTQTCNPYTAEDDSIDDDSLNSKDESLAYNQDHPTPKVSQLKDNERRNYELLREKVKELGSVPSMLKFTDLSCTIPDEKVIITYLSYLCARLLDLRLEGRAARIIQLAWRKYREGQQVKEIERKNHAAYVIQKCFRIYMENKRQELVIHSTVVIQAYVRGHIARRNLRHQQRAAAVIQSYYRSYRDMLETRDEFTKLKRVTLSMQSLYRGNITRRHLRRMEAARMIQSSWRGFLVRQEFLRQKQAVISLQAEMRKFIAKRRYRQLKANSLNIQRRYRAKLLTRRTRGEFVNLKKTVISLQAICRGNMARKEVRILKAAITIQKSVKMRRCRQEFLKIRESITKLQAIVRRNIAEARYKKFIFAAVVIQKRWRANRQGVIARKTYKQLKTSVVAIQSHYRQHIARKQYLDTRKKVILSQACVRAFLVRKEMNKRINACSVIQNYFRAYILMKKTAQDYKETKDASIKIQAAWRGKTARELFNHQKSVIILAQAQVRGCLVRRNYLRTKSAVIVLQVRYRALKQMQRQRRAYLETRDAIITLQAAQRGRRVREEMKRMTTAVTLIQTYFRRYIVRAHYVHLKHCVVVLQRQYRAWTVGRQVALEYTRTRNAAIVIQKYARGMSVRKEMHKLNQAAVIIQASFRRYRQHTAYLALQRVSTNMQRRFRANLKFQAAREEYLLKKKSVILLQRALRTAISVRQYQRQRQAAVVLQTRWRAELCSRKARLEFHCIRDSVITIQAFARGHKARKEMKRVRAAIKIQSLWRGLVQRKMYKKKRNAAQKLQACFRMLIAKSKYKKLKNTAVYLQRLVRANQLCRRHTRDYQTTRAAVVTLQAAVRGYYARKELERINKAATKIQASFRRFFIRQAYLETRRSALVIQRRRRATMMCRQATTEYQTLRSSVILLQSHMRGFIARKNFLESREKIVLLQSAVRRIQARNSYLQKRNAALTLQKRYRAFVQGSTVRKLYHLQRGACMALQANVRSWICRRRYLEMKKAANTIQVYYKATVCARKQRQEYLRLHKAVLTVQSFTRGWFARRKMRRYYAARCIQSWWRMYTVREWYAYQRTRVVRTQSIVRTWLCRRRFLALQEAVVVVQRQYRANQLGRKERDLFMEIKGSCFMIQHCYRFYRQRRLVRKMLESASTLRKASVTVQRRFRANQLAKSTRQGYVLLRTSTELIQTVYRGYRQRSEYKALKAATIKMQALTRGKQTSQNYKRIRAAAVVIQSWYRACTQGHIQRQIFVAQKVNAVRIQSFYRGFKTRSHYKKLKQVSITIQSLVRRNIARKTFIRLRNAAIVMQTRERARVLGQTQRSLFLMQKSCAVMLQSQFRGKRERTRFVQTKNVVVKLQALVRRKHAQVAFQRARDAVIVLQRRERARVLGKRQRESFLEQRHSAIFIQSMVRSHQQRKRYVELRQAVVTTQAHVRGKRGYCEYQKLRQAAIVTQRRERARTLGKMERESFLMKRKSVVCIQSWVKGCKRRRAYKRLRDATVTTQAFVRGQKQRKKYNKMRLAAVCIQKHYRAYRLGKETLGRYQCIKNATITIQSYCRGHFERQMVKRIRACLTIQAAYRGYVIRHWYFHFRETTVYVQSLQRMKHEQKQYKELRNATIELQRRVRANQLGRKVKIDYLETRNKVILIQAHWRGFKAREDVERIKSAEVIQRWYRACIASRRVYTQFVLLRKSIISMQACYRGNIARQQFRRERAARLIQAHVRGYFARALVKRLQAEKEARLLRFAAATYANLMVIRLQRVYRKTRAIALFRAKMDRLVFLQRWWRAKLERLSYLRKRYLVCQVQRVWRAKLDKKNQSAIKIQSAVRSFLAKRSVERRKKAIITLQCVWRGYNVRKHFNTMKFKKARQRIFLANSNVTESMKLCNLTSSALDYLLRCKNLTTVREALVHLEVASRLSNKCAEQLVTDSALHVIFKVVRDSNRSLAHMGLIKLALDIFVNVSKCPTTKNAVVTKEPNSFDTLVELACIFREKHEIFLRVTNLLTILCGNEEIKEGLLSMEKAVNKIKSIYAITKRKNDFERKRNTAKVNKLKVSSRNPTKSGNSTTAVNPLSAVVSLVETLGLDM
ncbi:abnormal spindle-like microcephaly-associated protein homolog [Dendronephthya gigantea]|uniref:abnormal spindle-like microcephaly-associated protein homolog n=1 Tax=Dendronephthya gigantea TaxID=151771 RepID=UPI001069C5A5|nr:abnormal spindle-like microcephaly-associated protein homolog [Dendronephthya gigantea]